MVFIALYIKADLENVTNLHAPAHHQWCLTVKQSDGSEERGPVFINEEEEHELTGSKGTAHFILKWEGSKKESYINVVRNMKGVTRPYCAEDSGKEVPIVVFECRGIEPIGWNPEGGYNCESVEGARFEDIDLSDDWCEYDEKAQASLEISNLTYSFKTIKEPKKGK
uniref:DUF866 domain-containing protein n=1 Tax=Pyramimonas obovata TaxID=1411642 RepID=A0A7S0WYL8_9CHLO|mmetsp:Transcript_8995/g.18632  ORF Transcript_8995/g.18632 Transcript_8995/m.18632 type:complete len:167 (+) Transcript_8995:62-562(+)|eukprot:CAMPEP_0118940094 /NCGR_PEP_ID=MMETSP1169-20130426/30580_1 /TAXON_ID=36882 /ORGANISM="Pyramimonas obovata, Strain CCMP722" /LENGTH=166 /DNA_ID=CAMNT_0006884495 /DNA_START=49 /DNA_END=549 /DNA_ORIENTATION=+